MYKQTDTATYKEKTNHTKMVHVDGWLQIFIYDARQNYTI